MTSIRVHIPRQQGVVAREAELVTLPYPVALRLNAWLERITVGEIPQPMRHDLCQARAVLSAQLRIADAETERQTVA